MEQRFQNRLEVSFGHRLGDSIADRGNSERPGTLLVLRDIHPTHRRREVTAGGQPIPQPIEVVVQLLFELLNRLAVDSRCHLVGFHPFVRLPHVTLSNTKRFGIIHASPPLASCPPDNTGRRRPFVRSHYRTFFPTMSDSVPVPRLGTQALAGAARLRVSLCIGATGSYVPHPCLNQAHAAFMPDASGAVDRSPLHLIRGDRVSVPVSTSCTVFRHVISGSLTFVFLILT